MFCRRFGVPLIDGGNRTLIRYLTTLGSHSGTIRLPALIGLSRAMDLILTGRPVSGADQQPLSHLLVNAYTRRIARAERAGEEAFNIGLANRLVDEGKAKEAAIQLAREISVHPQACLRADRQSALEGVFANGNLAREFELGSQVLHEAREGARAFAAGEGKHGTSRAKL